MGETGRRRARRGRRRPPGRQDAWGYASPGMRENLEGKASGASRGAPASTSSATRRATCSTSGRRSRCAPESAATSSAATRASARRSSPSAIDDVEVIVTRTEAEALHLEQNLVKRHRPPFNIRLRDDKSFPYIAVTLTDEYPRVMFTRERHRRGTVYFGPYANAKKVRETLDVLNRVFRFRPCEGPRPGRHSGIPCLDFHIDRCFAPCIGAISKEDYAAVIDGVVGFLSGDTQTIQAELSERMREAAADERFEEAARYRNRLFSIRHLADRQAADRRDVGSVDVIGLAIERRPGGRAGLSAARRQDDRPLRVPPRERRRRGRAVDPRGVRARVLRRVAERAAGGADPGRDGRRRRRSPSSSASAAARASSSGRRSAGRSGASSSSRPRTRSSRSRRTRPCARRRAPSESPRSRSSARC